MSNKNHSSGAKRCKCDKCEVEAHSIPGTTHRRCVGSPNEGTIRPRHDKLPGASRGTWQ